MLRLYLFSIKIKDTCLYKIRRTSKINIYIIYIIQFVLDVCRYKLLRLLLFRDLIVSLQKMC